MKELKEVRLYEKYNRLMRAHNAIEGENAFMELKAGELDEEQAYEEFQYWLESLRTKIDRILEDGVKNWK